MSAGDECLRIARAYSNQNSFLNSINPLARRLISQEAKKCRISNAFLKFFNKHQSDFNYVRKAGKELLNKFGY